MWPTWLGTRRGTDRLWTWTLGKAQMPLPPPSAPTPYSPCGGLGVQFFKWDKSLRSSGPVWYWQEHVHVTDLTTVQKNFVVANSWQTESCRKTANQTTLDNNKSGGLWARISYPWPASDKATSFGKRSHLEHQPVKLPSPQLLLYIVKMYGCGDYCRVLAAKPWSIS